MCPGKFIRSQLLAQQCPFLVKKEVSKEKEEDSKEELLEWMIGPTHQMLDESNVGHFSKNFIRLAAIWLFLLFNCDKKPHEILVHIMKYV